MAYDAKVIADSVSESGKRLTTLEVTIPRCVLGELNTHRVFSRNSASSRAIPVQKQLRRILEEPFVPEKFGVNQPGMQSFRWLENTKHELAREVWLTGRDRAVSTAFELLLGPSQAGEIFGYNPLREFADEDMLLRGFGDAIQLFTDAQKQVDPAETSILNVHKQLTNRALEPYMWHVVIITATEWDNFFALRINPDAQAEIRRPAELMLQAITNSTPELKHEGEWHVPFLQPEEQPLLEEDLDTALRACCARCARVSYLTHDGIRDLEADIALYTRLVNGGHMSPLEHVATPSSFKIPTLSTIERGDREHGNFVGWKQLRKFIVHEDNFALMAKG